MLDFVMSFLLIPFSIIILCLWGISVIIKQVSFIDGFWSLGFVLLTAFTYALIPSPNMVHTTLAIMVGLWGLRLSYHLTSRWLHSGEDPRYITMMGGREGLAYHIHSLWKVFGLQGLLIVLISLPIIKTLLDADASFSMVSYVGIALFLVGFYFEVVGDAQLKAFKADPSNKGKVLNTGLWRYTRHPNYFGDAAIWWGFWAISANLTMIYAPIIMTFLLMKVSGVPLLEEALKTSRPGYKDYIKQTNAFIPWKPKG